MHIIHTHDKPKNNKWSRGGKFKPIKDKVKVTTLKCVDWEDFKSRVNTHHKLNPIEFTGIKANVFALGAKRIVIKRYRFQQLK